MGNSEINNIIQAISTHQTFMTRKNTPCKQILLLYEYISHSEQAIGLLYFHNHLGSLLSTSKNLHTSEQVFFLLST
jgi:hypothetical protein